MLILPQYTFPVLLHVMLTERFIVLVIVPFVYLFATTEAVAVAPDLLEDLLLNFQSLLGQVVEIVEDVHLEEEPL